MKFLLTLFRILSLSTAFLATTVTIAFQAFFFADTSTTLVNTCVTDEKADARLPSDIELSKSEDVWEVKSVDSALDTEPDECESRLLVSATAYPPSAKFTNTSRGSQSRRWAANMTGPIAPLQLALLKTHRGGFRREAYLTSGWGYILETDHHDFPYFMIPISGGFVTDFASIPFGVHIFINPFGDHAEAAVVHDWLYAVGEGSDLSATEREAHRKFADLIFYKIMIDDGVDKIVARSIYSAVRIYGFATSFLSQQPAYGRENEWKFADTLTGESIPLADCELPRVRSAYLPRGFKNVVPNGNPLSPTTNQIFTIFSLNDIVEWTQTAIKKSGKANYNEIPRGRSIIINTIFQEPEYDLPSFLGDLTFLYQETWDIWSMWELGTNYFALHWLSANAKESCQIYNFLSSANKSLYDSPFHEAYVSSQEMLVSGASIVDVKNTLREGLGYKGLQEFRAVNQNLTSSAFIYGSFYDFEYNLEEASLEIIASWREIDFHTIENGYYEAQLLGSLARALPPATYSKTLETGDDQASQQ